VQRAEQVTFVITISSWTGHIESLLCTSSVEALGEALSEAEAKLN
jgi:hypothetical protein